MGSATTPGIPLSTSRRGHTEPQPLLDLAAAKAMNSARIPQGVASSKRRYVGVVVVKPEKTV